MSDTEGEKKSPPRRWLTIILGIAALLLVVFAVLIVRSWPSQGSASRRGSRVSVAVGEFTARTASQNYAAVGLPDGSIYLYRLPSTNLGMSNSERQHRSRLVSLAISPDERFLASADAEGTILIWSINHWKNDSWDAWALGPIDPDREPFHVSFRRDGRLGVVGENGIRWYTLSVRYRQEVGHVLSEKLVDDTLINLQPGE